MDYNRIESFKQLAEEIQRHIEFAYDYNIDEKDMTKNSPSAMNYFLGENPNFISNARTAFIRLKMETKIEGLPKEVPNDEKTLMNLCLEADKILHNEGKKSQMLE